jgi:hypothetical protein
MTPNLSLPGGHEFASADPPTSPWVGLIAVATSVAIALLSIPNDLSPWGALYFPALVLTLGLLASPALTAFRDPTSVFRVENLVMLGLVYWILLDLLQAMYDVSAVGRPAIMSAFLMIGLFAIGVWLAGLHRPWGLPRVVLRAAQTNWSEGQLFGAFLTCAGFTLFRYAWPCGFDPFLMITSLGGSRWSAPWTTGYVGNWNSFIAHLEYFGFLLPSLTVLLANRARLWYKPAVIASMLITLALTPFLAHGGNRRTIGVMYGGAILCWVLLQRKAISLRSLFFCAIAGVIMLYAMETIAVYRGIGYEMILSEKNDNVVSISRVRVDDNFLRLAQTIEIVPLKHPHIYEKMFVFALIRPIPRVFWPGKPLDAGFDLAKTIGARGVALTTSAIGEFYMSWGWPMVLFGGWLFGRLAGMCNRFLTDAPGGAGVLMFALGAMAIFAGLRSINDIVLMSYQLLAWIVISRYLSPHDEGR